MSQAGVVAQLCDVVRNQGPRLLLSCSSYRVVLKGATQEGSPRASILAVMEMEGYQQGHPSKKSCTSLF